MDRFCDRLRRIVDQTYKSHQEFADALGVSASTVSNWLKDCVPPKFENLERICRLLNVSADWLLGLAVLGDYEHEYNGIRWTEQVPNHITGLHREEAMLGIALFRAVVIDNQGFEQLRKDARFRNRSLSSLASIFATTVRVGALQLTDVPRDTEKERALVARFPALQGEKAIVASIPQCEATCVRAELVAFLAATEALIPLKGRSIIGLGPGYTMLRFAELSVPSTDQFQGTTWVPLVASAARNLGSRSANHITLLMANRHPGSEALYLPHPHQNTPDEHEQCDKVFKACLNAGAAFASVNGPRYRSSEPFRMADDFTFGNLGDLYRLLIERSVEKKFAGEFLGLMLDANAQPISEIEKENQEAFYQVELETLRGIAYGGDVWIIAAGGYKAKPVLTVLKNGIANAVVLDSEIAEYLIENA